MGSPVGRYQRLKAIASGGMATVYLGRAVGAGGFERFVAIKVMHPHLAADPDFVASFLDEARLAARVRHPNVVATLDVDAADDGLFLVMDYVDGQTLYAMHKRQRATKTRMPVPVALRIMIDALAGLHAAHELTADDGTPLNLVHRDVSPQNIIVGHDGISRIVDFGVARAESRLGEATHTGQVKGKYGYMSIEQLRAWAVDRRSDVYSAAVVMWELLAGERLFKGDNEAAIALAAAAGAVQSPQDVNADVPQPLDDVVMRALQLAPDGRYPSAAAFSDAIEDAAHACGVRPARPREVSEFLEQIADDAVTELRPNALLELSRRLSSRGAQSPACDGGDTDRLVFDDPPSVTDARSCSRSPLATTAPQRQPSDPLPEAPPSADAARDAGPAATCAAAPSMPAAAPGLPAGTPAWAGAPLAAGDGWPDGPIARRPTPLELHALTPSFSTTHAGTLVTANLPPIAPPSRPRAALVAIAVSGVLSVISVTWLMRSPSDDEPASTVTGAPAQAAPATIDGERGLHESAVPSLAAPRSASTTAPATTTPASPSASGHIDPSVSSSPTSGNAAPRATPPKASAAPGGAKPSGPEPYQPKLL